LSQCQAAYQEAAADAKAFADKGRELQQELAAARKSMKDQDLQADQLRGRWLALLDFAGDSSQQQHVALSQKCDEWIAANPMDGAALLARCISQFWLGNGEVQNEIKPLADKKWDSQGVAAALRGLMRCCRGDAAGAKADFDRAIRAAPREPKVYLCRGLSHCRETRWNEAAADFEKAAQLDAHSALPHRLLSLLYASSSGAMSAAKALHHAQQAQQLAGPDDWTVLDSLAAAFAASGQYEDAIKTIQQAAESAPNEKRQQCLDRQALYAKRQPLRIEWLKVSEIPQ
jgi:tetratricopeptide (TPR) repeat protein